jgi:hypothetical protein
MFLGGYFEIKANKRKPPKNITNKGFMGISFV